MKDNYSFQVKYADVTDLKWKQFITCMNEEIIIYLKLSIICLCLFAKSFDIEHQGRYEIINEKWEKRLKKGERSNRK